MPGHVYLNAVDGIRKFADDTNAVRGIGPFKTKHRGASMFKVDVALNMAVEMLNGDRRVLVCVVSNLLREVKAAKRKLQEKVETSNKLKRFFGGERRERRLRALEKLKNECLLEIATHDPGVKLALRVFEARKFGGKKPGGIGLSKGYEAERSTYLASNKKSAISMNNFGFTMDTAISILEKEPGGQAFFQKLSSTSIDAKKEVAQKNNTDYQMLSGDQEGEADRIVAQNLTDQEISTVLEVAERGGGKSVTQVYMMDKLRRLKAMVVPDDTGLLRYPTGDVFDTTIGAVSPGHGGAWMWAMDCYGNLYVSKDLTDDLKPDRQRFNHSSFMAGGEVLCAGMICASAGRLMFLSNNSGHYKPGIVQLHGAMSLLADDGLLVANTCVQVCTPTGKTYCRGTDFVSNMNAPNNPKFSPFCNP